MANIKTKRGAIRRYNAIIRKCYADMRGGTQYGVDWPTLAVTWPDRAAEILTIKAMFKNLPE